MTPLIEAVNLGGVVNNGLINRNARKAENIALHIEDSDDNPVDANPTAEKVSEAGTVPVSKK